MKSLREALVHKHMDQKLSLETGDVVIWRNGVRGIFIEGDDPYSPDKIFVPDDTIIFGGISSEFKGWDPRTFRSTVEPRCDIVEIFKVSKKYQKEFRLLKGTAPVLLKYIDDVMKDIRPIRINQ